MKFSLLPPEQDDRGWLPYIWLVYLLFFLAKPLTTEAHPRWPEHLAGTVLFLLFYFGGYWARNLRKLWAMAGLVALGFYFAPFNGSASVFFIYAAGFAGEVGSVALAQRLIAILLALVAVTAYFLQPNPGFWITASVFTVIIGVVSIHFTQRHRANVKLRLAQEEVERLAKIAERERIGRDLHDLLGHTLSVIVLKAELASKMADKDMSRAAAEIRDVERISRKALAEVRAAVAGYRSSSLSAEAETAAKALESAGVSVEADLEALQLPVAQESVLAMALREAATNIVRHARATACTMRLRGLASACELEVTDNGSGGEAREGFGLSGMRQRIEALGGTLERDGSNGTRLRIRLPLSSA
jgi:two-component system sensor histidine kinase DesK